MDQPRNNIHPETKESAATTRSAVDLVVVGLVGLVCLLSLWLYGPPRPLGKDAALTEFSAARALVYLREICRNPHPTGSPEHARVRDYIVAQARKLGLATEIQTASFTDSVNGRIFTGKMHNIIAILKGKKGTGKKGTASKSSLKSILLVAHYD